MVQESGPGQLILILDAEIVFASPYPAVPLRHMGEIALLESVEVKLLQGESSIYPEEKLLRLADMMGSPLQAPELEAGIMPGGLP